MSILIALVPAIMWGSIGLVSGRLGGSASQQTLGMTMGAVVFALITLVLYQPVLNGKIWIAGLISGLFWAVGQFNQFSSMKHIGVSKTVPISTGLQLAGNALAGVLIWHEWTSGNMIMVGTLAVITLIVGAAFTSLKDKSDKTVEKDDENMSAGIRSLIISTIGYIGYTVVVRFADVDAKAIIFPQAIGMLIGALIFVLIAKEQKEIAKKPTFLNIITGLIWGTGNIFMFLAIPSVGLAISYSLAQAGIVISTFGSIWLLGERKTHREMQYVVIGSILIIVGSTLLATLK
ncbi:GRP family sugar transporter [Pediococcus stilesii]|uniref:Glucose transporter GlcU n=1 Tax=Pediococcus stilesii TaxID=331679 RepID=A0A0R2KXK8_9LACO|nr:GRP family sugar transporter [Pediococcus stilesii]KRN94267.1 glucose uptake permease [Pediococcus stilesii]TLQ05311.1 glucose transporter GlcU [Pediococcus stilesii]